MGFDKRWSENIDSKWVLKGQSNAIIEDKQACKHIKATSKCTIVTNYKSIESKFLEGGFLRNNVTVIIGFIHFLQHLVILLLFNILICICLCKLPYEIFNLNLLHRFFSHIISQFCLSSFSIQHIWYLWLFDGAFSLKKFVCFSLCTINTFIRSYISLLFLPLQLLILDILDNI